MIHYGFIEKFIEELGTKYHIKEIAFDRWGAMLMIQDLECMGFTVVPFGKGYKDMSPPTKELMKLTLEERIAHGGHEDKEKSNLRRKSMQQQPLWHLTVQFVIRAARNVYMMAGNSCF